MATPYLSAIDAYDVLVGTTIYYEANNAFTDIRATKVFIEDATGNPIGNHLYVAEPDVLATQHVLSPLPTTTTDDSWEFDDETKYRNNKQMVMYITTYLDEEATIPIATSNKIGFWALSTPNLQINIDEREIATTSYTVTAIYNPNNASITNTINEVVFNLHVKYDYKQYKRDQLVASSDKIYTSGVYIGNGNYQLNYKFDNLVNKCEYYITVECLTSRGMYARDGFSRDKTIIPDVDISAITLITPTNNACDGSIDIHTSISDISGKMESEHDPAELITDKGIELNSVDDSLIYDNGLAFSNNYNMSIWAKDFVYADRIVYDLDNIDTRPIICLRGQYGTISVFMIQDEDEANHKALLYVRPYGDTTAISIIESNELPIPTGENDYTCIGIQYKNARYGVTLTTVTIEP